MFDLKDGNWRNSEVVRAFLETWEEPVAAEVPVIVAEVPVATADLHAAQLRKTAYVNKIIDELNAVASELANDSAAALEVEMVIEDIKKELLCKE